MVAVPDFHPLYTTPDKFRVAPLAGRPPPFSRTRVVLRSRDSIWALPTKLDLVSADGFSMEYFIEKRDYTAGNQPKWTGELGKGYKPCEESY